MRMNIELPIKSCKQIVVISIMTQTMRTYVYGAKCTNSQRKINFNAKLISLVVRVKTEIAEILIQIQMKKGNKKLSNKW